MIKLNSPTYGGGQIQWMGLDADWPYGLTAEQRFEHTRTSGELRLFTAILADAIDCLLSHKPDFEM